MPIMAKSNDEYTEVKAIKTPNGTEIDYVLSKVDNTYKRTYTATRELEDTPPLEFKSIKPQANLLDYRIYGQTSRNLFDGEFLQGYWALADGLFNVSNKWISTKKIPCKSNAQYTFSSSFLSRWAGFLWYDENDNYLSSDTAYNITLLTKTSPSNAAYMAIDIAGYPDVEANIKPSDVTDLMLVEGSTPLPYEPYGESVGDRTANLFDGEFLQGYWAGADGNFVASDKWICTNKFKCKPSITYTFSFNTISRWYGFAWYDSNGTYISSTLSQESTTQTLPIIYTVTSPANAAYFAVDIAGYPYSIDSILPTDVTDLMLVEGSTPLPYEPYGYKVPVTVEGKNLLPNTARSQTINGVTFTVNDDGSVTCNGEATATAALEITNNWQTNIILGNRYIGSGCPSGGSDATYYLDLHNFGHDTGDSVITRASHTEGGSYKAQIVIRTGYTCDNLTFYPMIRKASITDDTYEPYHTPVTTPIYLPEQIKKVGDEAEYIDYGTQKFVKKFYKITLNFDDMNNHELFPGWSGGTAVVEYCNKIRSLAIDNPNSYTPVQYSSISNFTAHFNVINSVLWLGTSSALGHTQSELKEIYAGQSITFILKIPDTDLNVTLPALPTVTGTNVLSVGTEVQPSDMYIKGNFKMIAGGGE